MKSLRSFALALLVLFTFGCSPFAFTCIPTPTTCTTPVAFTRSFDFEHCTDALCGFTLVTGNARVVSAFHTGEHALQIDAGGAVTIQLRGVLANPRGGEDVTVIARCDSGASLGFREGLTLQDGAQTSRRESSLSTRAGTDWSSVTLTFFALDQPFASTTVTAIPNDLTVEVGGSGSCTIDDVIYTAHTQTCPTGFAFDAGSPFDSGTFDTGRRDGGQDSPGLLPSVFIPCTTNAQCGTGGTCLTTFPGGGICTRRCTNDRACGSDGVCETQNMICLPACSSGGGECDQYGGGCVPLDEAFTTGACLPSCFTTGAPAGYPMCAAPMAMCDPYSGVCTTMQPTGAANGDPCTADSDCAGNRCITEVDTSTGEPSGWIGGYCLSFARADDIHQGQPIPVSNCPPGAGVVPLGGEQVGDLAPCFKTCDADTDCRPGYRCDHLEAPMDAGVFFSNGFCNPIDCSMTGMQCPSGYACIAHSTMHVCAADPDASVAADASVEDVADDAILDAGIVE